MKHPLLRFMFERSAMSRELWQRNLIVLWFAQFVAMIGMSAVLPFLPLYVRELGVPQQDAAFWSGLINAAPFITSSIMTPVWGAMSDRFGQKTMVIRAVIGLGLTVALMGFAPNVWVLLFLRLLQGAVSGFIAANNAFVSTQTPTEHAGMALSTLQTSVAAGTVVGPLIGGAISDAAGANVVFFVVGGLCAISSYILWSNLVEERVAVNGHPPRVLRNMRIVVREPMLRYLLLTLFIVQTALMLPSPIYPYYLAELGAPSYVLSSITGTIVSLVGIMSVISGPWWGARSDRLGFRPTMMAAAGVVSMGMLAQAFVPTYHWLFPIRAIMGIATGALQPLVFGELTRRAPAGRKGGIMGMASSATLAGNLTGPLMCAALAPWMPHWMLFVVSAITMASIVMIARRA
ncbi:MAG: multidrug efflux MFS transporter [Candidatus Kapabacteria bacterium]|nr:multidrug efflux MFS transporter [Candidatus Kapabacteria bacterium]